MKKIITVLVMTCAISLVAFAQQPVMLKDMSPGNIGSDPAYITIVNGVMFYAGQYQLPSYPNTNYGIELCKSDGTIDGTVMVKDIKNAVYSGSNPELLTAVGTTLYFSANDGINGRELWKSDGSANGTVLVKDINPGSLSGINKSSFINLNGVLMFVADDGVAGLELWKSDGTDAGTVMVKDINTGIASSSIQNFVVVGSTLFFTADNGVAGSELWKTDGTTAGTVMVKDINPKGSGVAFDAYSFQYSYFINLNGTLYFKANDGVTGEELWKSDGTSAGTVLVKDMTVGASSTPWYFGSMNNEIYFTLPYASELWKSDGTSIGTVKVASRSMSGVPFTIKNTMYFFSLGELWKTDGTTLGTVIVKKFPTGGGTPKGIFANISDTLYCNVSAGGSVSQLAKTDGTPSGTVVYPTYLVTNPNYLTNYNGNLFFSGYTSFYSAELWTITLVSGVENRNKQAVEFRLSPNPSTNEVSVLSNQSFDRVELYNSTGVFLYTTSASILSVSHLPSGLYYVKVYSELGMSTQKFIKQ